MEKTGLKESASAAKPAKIAKKAPKGAVTESKTFRDGLIYLYQRADFKKPTWLCRVKVPNASGYVNRSTGTGDEHIGTSSPLQEFRNFRQKRVLSEFW